MTKLYAPWRHGIYFAVEPLKKPHRGNRLARWLEGPLKDREARLDAKSLKTHKP